MKVISGKYKGRNIKGYNIEGTRPTQDRVKESLFSMIQGYLSDSVSLDLFSGSGNLGIECLSNNSAFCYFVDNNKRAINIINDNLSIICHDIENSFKVLTSDYKSALVKFKKDKIKFDIIFLDPPYNTNYLDDCLSFIDKNNLLNNNGIVVVEYEFLNFNEEFLNLEEIKCKKYGYKYIKIYKNK